ncbi:hypothetical protein H4Q26_008363 [Puccinia striiformis f. sp. tritici PST-130]|nr:hypothetical protein H4Q26_008363 [Puccinia striiformis f. sp. tritici PST-130]
MASGQILRAYNRLIIAPSSKLLQAVSSIAGANPAGGLPGRLGETEPHSLTEKSASYGEVDSVGWNPPYKNLRFHRKRSSNECSICLEDLATNQVGRELQGAHHVRFVEPHPQRDHRHRKTLPGATDLKMQAVHEIEMDQLGWQVLFTTCDNNIRGPGM